MEIDTNLRSTFILMTVDFSELLRCTGNYFQTLSCKTISWIENVKVKVLFISTYVDATKQT